VCRQSNPLEPAKNEKNTATQLANRNGCLPLNVQGKKLNNRTISFEDYPSIHLVEKDAPSCWTVFPDLFLLATTFFQISC